MTATLAMRDQTEAAYRRMAEEVRWRPAAPIDWSTWDYARPFNPGEAAAYAARWLAEEDTQDYSLGCPDFSDRPALIFTVEAARCLNGMDHRRAARLLRMALTEIEKEHTA